MSENWYWFLFLSGSVWVSDYVYCWTTTLDYWEKERKKGFFLESDCIVMSYAMGIGSGSLFGNGLHIDGYAKD